MPDFSFQLFLELHSWNRWAVLLLLLWCIGSAYYKKRHLSPYTNTDDFGLWMLLAVIFIQTFLGAILYWKSPLAQFFLNNPSEGISHREIRFFGLEHITVMTLAAVIITLGIYFVMKAPKHIEKHALTIKWLGIGLLLILSSIPWSFSPLISRPLLRF